MSTQMKKIMFAIIVLVLAVIVLIPIGCRISSIDRGKLTGKRR